MFPGGGLADDYIVLGVAQNASDNEITVAWRRLVSKLHPDKNANDAAADEQLRKVNAAYQRLVRNRRDSN
jgi:molecular chaperone DnaJ